MTQEKMRDALSHRGWKCNGRRGKKERWCIPNKKSWLPLKQAYHSELGG